MLSGLLDLLGDLLAPPACAACDAPVPRRRVFCPACAATVARLAPGAPIACASYGGALATAIRRFKYDARPDLARPLGDLLRAAVRAAAPRVDLVVPVPLHPGRLVERGYNQAALLGAPVARELHVPLAARALVRVRATAPQARLGRGARADNLEAAFRPSSAAISGARVLLVDDVTTTGATLAACAAALRAGGAREVVSCALARSGA